MDPAVRAGGDQGVPVVVSHPDSPVAKALNDVAEDLAAKISVAALQPSNFVPINLIG
jgi:ATP-binding protein involved in chromosome partitioning